MQSPSEAQILELAQQRIADRRRGQEQRWRMIFLGALSALLLVLVLWPGLPLQQKLYAVGHGICAQEHSVDVGGLTLPICARNTGIYGSYLLTTIVLLAVGRGRAGKVPSGPLLLTLVLFVAIMGVDGFNSLFNDMLLPHLYTPMNWLRTLTGIGMGVAIAVFVLMILNTTLRADLDPNQAVVGNWLELGGLLLLNTLLLVAMYGNLSFMYWPVAIISTVGIVGVLYAVNMMLAAVATGYEGKVRSWAQLGRPATIALVMTLIEVGALSGVRYWMESQGMMV